MADQICNPLQLLARKMKDKAKNIIVMCGAGISVNCGIPDFRSQGGLYERLATDFKELVDPTDMFHIDFFKKNPIPFTRFAAELIPTDQTTIKPSKTHYAIKELENAGRLLRVYTQNIDGLELKAGISQDKLVQCHGSFQTASCIVCGKQVKNIEKIHQNIRNEKTSHCHDCHGLVKPDIVFFEEPLPKRFSELWPSDFKHKCDLLIVLGTSLTVHPFAGLVDHVDYRCARILINRDQVGQTSFDFTSGQREDVFFQGDVDEGMELFVRELLEE
jgi:NAD-dependent SIR2 family protein deacetylase